MELNEGYRLTEAGPIPDDWELKSIGTEIDVLTGFPFPSSGYTETGIRLLRGSNVKRGVTDWSEDLTQHWHAVTGDIAKFELVCGDLVIAMDGSLVGRSYARLGVDDTPALLLQRVARIRSRKLDVGYLKAFVSSDRFIRYIDSVKTVTAIPHISPSDIKNFTIPVPPTFEEQQAIASALSDVDALIIGLERLIAKNRDIKQATMQRLLTGQTRLPGFSDQWDQGAFGDVVSSLEAGVSVNSTDGVPEDGVPCILKTSALVSGTFLPYEAKVIEAREITRARISPIRDTILISRMNTPMLVGEVAYVPKDFDALFLPDRVWMARFNLGKSVCARWLAYVLSSRTYRGLLREVATGTSGSMKNISKSALLSLPIRYPSLEEQTAIATILADIDINLSALEFRLAKTHALKQGMMQELLTGRTRLVNHPVEVVATKPEPQKQDA